MGGTGLAGGRQQLAPQALDHHHTPPHQRDGRHAGRADRAFVVSSVRRRTDEGGRDELRVVERRDALEELRRGLRVHGGTKEMTTQPCPTHLHGISLVPRPAGESECVAGGRFATSVISLSSSARSESGRQARRMAHCAAYLDGEDDRKDDAEEHEEQGPGVASGPN